MMFCCFAVLEFVARVHVKLPVRSFINNIIIIAIIIIIINDIINIQVSDRYII